MQSSFTHPDRAASSVLRSLTAIGFQVELPVAATCVLLDTFDARLHRAGLRLEHRGGEVGKLVLAGPAGTPTAYLAWAKELPRFGSDFPTGPFGQRVASLSEERALIPGVAFTTHTRVASQRDRRGKVVVSVLLHERPSVDGAEVELPSWVAEVVGVVGHDAERAEAFDRLARLGLVPTNGTVADVVARALEISLEGHTSVPTVALDAKQDALSAYRAVLLNLVSTMRVNLPGTLANTDPEFLHELRVAVRRTRSVLSQGRGVLPEDVRLQFATAFGQLGTLTGPARDLDVYVMGWDLMVAPLRLPDPRVLVRVRGEIERRRRAAHAILSVELGGEACRQTLEDWSGWLAGTEGAQPKPKPIGPWMARRIAKAHARVVAHGRAITPASPPEALHDLRKDAKKLRYLLECFGGLLPRKGRKAFVGQLKVLQDNLGDHQDAEVQLAELRMLAHDLHARARVDTDALLAMGRLSDLLDRRRREQRELFVERFASYDTEANALMLTAMLDAVEHG
ncbi:MAG: CHAD domain-containing protein [Acidimicrobiia bacterium]|nr:CHAD domain-containing protein [Acidimicrobiia bacterium]